MSGGHVAYKRLGAISLVIVAVALVSLAESGGLVVLAAPGSQPMTALQRGGQSPGTLAGPTPEPSPAPPRPPAHPSSAAPAQCSGTDCTITSLAGWQQTYLALKQGEQFSISYLGGTWTVDKRNWPLVGPEGYAADVDQRIGYAACKLDGRWPFAALLGKVGEGSLFLAGRGGTFTADRDGSLYLATNDVEACQGDNDGSVSVRLAKPSCARLSVVPAHIEIPRGATGTTEVQVTDVTNLYGIQLNFNFDPNVVQVVDADTAKSGVQISIGALFKSRRIFVARNMVNNTTGVGELAVTLVAPETPISGSGTVAVITWQGKNEGQSPITLTLTGLAPASQPICHTIENGSIKVTSGPAISGHVLLEGGQDHGGTNVFLTVAPRTCAVKFCTQELANVPLDVTDREGRFEISPDPGRSYPWLWAYHACYLTGTKHWPQGELGTLTLLAGDLNEDNCVNIYDLAIMGQRFRGQDSCADYTQDGQVDIFDLVLVARNLGKCGPVSDWAK